MRIKHINIMKNIHVIPTDKPSKLILQSNNKFRLSEIKFKGQIASGVTQNIYITSDEEIKEGEENEWYYDTNFNKITKWIGESNTYVNRWFKKIILTTDQDLIKDGVQAIDDEFLEWFINNTSCEEFEVVKEYKHFTSELYGYKIIIPKEGLSPFDLQESPMTDNEFYQSLEEPKQETLEEAGVIAAGLCEHLDAKEQAMFIAGFVECVKWQQERRYSEEEVIDILVEFSAELKIISNITKWFKQFKKK